LRLKGEGIKEIFGTREKDGKKCDDKGEKEGIKAKIS